MLNLFEALRDHCRLLWQGRGRLRGLFGTITPKQQRAERANRADARTRFWDAVREGQREAEAHCSKRNP